MSYQTKTVTLPEIRYGLKYREIISYTSIGGSSTCLASTLLISLTTLSEVCKLVLSIMVDMELDVYKVQSTRGLCLCKLC